MTALTLSVDHPELPVQRVCSLLGVARSGFYRSLRKREEDSGEQDLIAKLEALALEHPTYGSRRLAKELRRQGWPVGRKLV